MFPKVPIPRTTNVPREQDLERLADVLLPKAPSEDPKILVLHGLGGIGKTQLSLNFIHARQNEFSGTLWLDASTEESLIRQLSDNCRSILDKSPELFGADSPAKEPETPEEEAKVILSWFSKPENQHWLLVYDNYDNLEGEPGGYNITPHMPATRQGSILITSRRAYVAEQLEAQAMSLGSMNLGLSRQVFNSHYAPKSIDERM